MRWSNTIAMILALLTLVLAAPACATTFATITSGGSADRNQTTAVKIGTTLNVSGTCEKSWWSTRTGAHFTLFEAGKPQGRDLKASRTATTPTDETQWLDHPTVDIPIGNIPGANIVGARFQVQLVCSPVDIGMTSFANRYFEVVAANAPPKVEWLGTNPVYSKGDTRIQVRVTATNDGVGDVFVKWTGEAARDLKMQHIEGDLYEYTIAGSAPVPEGLKKVDIRATSQSGVHAGWQQAGSFTLDRTPPTIEWDRNNPAFANGHRITIKVNVNDASGIADIWLLWTGSNSYTTAMKKNSAGQYEYTIDTSNLPPGRKYVQFWARDNAGNDTNWQIKGNFMVRGEPPTIKWDNTNPAWTRGGIRIKVDIADPDSSNVKAWIRWTGTSSATNEMRKGAGRQYYYDIPSLPDGIKSVWVRAEDSEENSTGWVAVGKFVVDKTPPLIVATSVEIDKTSGDITVKATLPDPFTGVDSAWASFAEPAAANANSKMTSKGGNIFVLRIDAADLRDGVHILRIRAIDFHGNDTGWVDRDSITLDRTPPVIDWTMPQDMASFSGDGVRIAGTVSDAAPQSVIVEWRQENTDAWHSATLTIASGSNVFGYNLPDLDSNKRYQLRLRAVDIAGNVSPDTPIRTVQAGYPPEKEQLLLQKTVDRNSAKPGDILHYIITYTNVSNGNLHNLVITDEIQSRR